IEFYGFTVPANLDQFLAYCIILHTGEIGAEFRMQVQSHVVMEKTYLLVDSGFLTIEFRRKCTQKNCGKCGAIITGNDEWEDHIKMHLNNDDYVCYKCGMDFPSLTELIEHYKDHLPSCSKQWSSKSENDDREKKSLRDNVSRKLKFDKPTVLYDSRNRNENMPELMKQVDELKLKASLIFKNVNKKKEIKKLHYPILNSRTAKKGAQVLSKWRKYLEDEKNEIVNYQENIIKTTKHEKGEVTSGVNNDHLYCVRAISDKEYMKQKEEVLFQSGNHDKNQGRDSDFAKSETLDKENGAFVRMFKKYLEEERKQEKKQERKKKNEDESKIDKNTMMFDDVENGKKATKYEEEWSAFGRNNDCVYFAKWIKPEDLLKQKKENSFCSHKEEQGVESDVIKSETLDEEGAAFVRMFKKYLEEEKKQEQENESEEKGEDESDIEEIIIMRDNDAAVDDGDETFEFMKMKPEYCLSAHFEQTILEYLFLVEIVKIDHTTYSEAQ
ncbi:hypothetical protein T4D_2550, partial [Trichinella pseudospiralis]